LWSDLQGRSAVITGAGSGIGRGTALAMGRRGALVTVADIDAGRAEVVAQEVRTEGGRALAVACDVSQNDQLEHLRDRSLEEFGRIDILMNNAGVMAAGLPEEIPIGAWQKVLNVNLLGTVRGIHAFLPSMLQQGEGHIVTTASTAGLYPYSYDRLPYAASKAALVATMEGLFLYLRPKGIGVTCLCPGPVTTDIAAQRENFGAARKLQGPGLNAVSADFVGDLVVDAVLSDRFLLLTHPEVDDVLRERGSDIESFLHRQADHLASGSS
jgi:NAD(P)-dependent dehydrogenase (short-subunit alcohol dehydrogenase family)